MSPTKKKQDTSRSNKAQRWLDGARVRWESLRRRDEYRKDYQSAVELRAQGEAALKKKNWPSRRPREYYLTKQAGEEKKLADKYGIVLLLIDPALKWGELTSFQKSTVLQEPSGLMPIRPIQGGQLALEIDFNAVKSIAQLKKDVAEMIDVVVEFQLNPDPEFSGKTGRADKGKRDLDKILLAGELAEAGRKPKEIAKMIFPDHFESKRANAKDQQDSALKNVAHLCAEYRRIFNGG